MLWLRSRLTPLARPSLFIPLPTSFLMGYHDIVVACHHPLYMPTSQVQIKPEIAFLVVSLSVFSLCVSLCIDLACLQFLACFVCICNASHVLVILAFM